MTPDRAEEAAAEDAVLDVDEAPSGARVAIIGPICDPRLSNAAPTFASIGVRIGPRTSATG